MGCKAQIVCIHFPPGSAAFLLFLYLYFSIICLCSSAFFSLYLCKAQIACIDFPLDQQHFCTFCICISVFFVLVFVYFWSLHFCKAQIVCIHCPLDLQHFCTFCICISVFFVLVFLYFWCLCIFANRKLCAYISRLNHQRAASNKPGTQHAIRAASSLCSHFQSWEDNDLKRKFKIEELKRTF